MAADPDLVYAALAVLAGYVVLGITGFGSALLIVPVLSWRWPLSEVVPLVLLLDLPAAALHGGLNLHAVQWRELRRMGPGLLMGSLLGLWCAGTLPTRWPLLALGLYVLVTGWRALRATAPQRPWPGSWVHGAGVAAGTVEMMFGTAGPLLVTWLARRLPDAQALRATTPVAIVACTGMVLATLAWTGPLREPELWQRWLLLLGPGLTGVLVGHWLALRVPAPALKRAVCVLLMVSGSLLFGHALT